MRIPLPTVFACVALFSAGFAPSATAADLPKDATPVLAAMQAELAHSLAALKSQSTPPYFLSYEITETRRTAVSSSFGALVSSTEGTSRMLDIDLRVGSPALDNTHAIRGGGFGGGGGGGATSIPVEDSPDAIRATLWYQTDRRYKTAVEQFTRVKTNVQVKVEEDDKSADFAAEPAQTFADKPVVFTVDRRALEEKVRRFTAPFAAHPRIYAATASITVGVETRWYVNSEGTLLQTSQPGCRIVVSAVTKAEDGMELPRLQTYFAFRPEQLPSDETVLAEVKKIIADLEALRTAPLVDPFTGPAILSGRAAGVFFHEVFGHRIEGHRQKRAEEGQTFNNKTLGQKVLPDMFTVFCDPSLARYANTELGGHYLYDNQGVKARRVSLIEGGVFTGFLMARIPIESFPASNGHGRKAVGSSVVSRQSNLIVESAKSISHAALRQELLKLVNEQKKPYGLLIDDIQGGFAITGRSQPNAFNVQPLLVYRLFPDGREELVRGADLIGTPLSAFSKIVAADDTPGIFNGVCGAESGWVPVSAVSPALLLSQVEVQKKEKSQERLPLLPAPGAKTE